MRSLTRWLVGPAWLTLVLLAPPRGAPTPAALAQSAWAPEPTYRYAGHYEGEWTAEASPDSTETASGRSSVFEQRAGELRGTVGLDVGCDGAVSGQARGQTRLPIALAAIADGAEGPRVLAATLDLVVEGAFTGAVGSRGAEGPTSAVEAALRGSLRDLPSELETVAVATSLERWYTGAGRLSWGLLEGAPGRLAGSAGASVQLLIPDSADRPPLPLHATGRWIAARVAAALCPWQASVSVSGAVGNEQLQEERLDLTFQITPDGRVEGEGRGQAAIRGGPPGGCVYSGGGPFAVVVGGEVRDGRLYLRLEDFEQPQLLLTTTCADGRFVGPQAPLSTRFGPIEVPAVAGAQAHLTLPPTVPDARGTLDVVVTPALGAAPP